jgi:hypothetical protein
MEYILGRGMVSRRDRGGGRTGLRWIRDETANKRGHVLALPPRIPSGGTYQMYYGLKGNKCLACGKPTPCYNINHAIKYSNNNFATVLVTCHARRNYK